MKPELEYIDIKDFYRESYVSEMEQKKIPNNFFQTFKTSLFDHANAKRMAAFREIHKEFNFYFYDDDAMDKYMEEHWSHHPIFKVYQTAIFGSSKADIWRYCILFEFGGVYLDIDAEIMFNMNTIPNNIEEIVSFEENKLSTFSWHYNWPFLPFFKAKEFEETALICPGNIAMQWLLVFKPKHWILNRVIDLIVENHSFFNNQSFENVLHAVVSFSGPLIYTQAVWEYAQSGASLFQLGYEFNRLAKFKSILDPVNSVYLNDSTYYATKINKPVCQDKTIVQVIKDSEAETTHNQYIKVNYSSLKQLSGTIKIDQLLVRGILESLTISQLDIALVGFCDSLVAGGMLVLFFPCLDQVTALWTKGLISLTSLNNYLYPETELSNQRKSLPSSKYIVEKLQSYGMDTKFVKNHYADSIKTATINDEIFVTIRAIKK